jgi:hypothetical protein
MDCKSIFIAFACLVAFACSPNENEHFILFNTQNYPQLEANLAKDNGTWQHALLKNKLAIETKREAPFSSKELWQRFSADKEKNTYALHPYYTQFKLLPTAYVKTLMALVDSGKTFNPPEFYFPALFKFLESKYAENRQFAYGKLVANFNFRYKDNLYSPLRRILADSIYPKSYQLQLKRLAGEFDYYDKETIYHSNSEFDHTRRIELIELVASDEIEMFFRFRGKGRSIESPHINDVTSYDLFRSSDSLLRKLLPTVAKRQDVAYPFILSNRKVQIDSLQAILNVLEGPLSLSYQNRIIQLLKLTNPDSVVSLLSKDSLPSFAKLYFFNQLEIEGYSRKKMNVLFELFKERKLQAEIEKHVISFPSDSLSPFFEEKLASKNPQTQSFALYLLGKAELTSFIPKVEKLRASEYRNVSFEAKQTLRRLKKE